MIPKTHFQHEAHSTRFARSGGHAKTRRKAKAKPMFCFHGKGFSSRLCAFVVAFLLAGNLFGGDELRFLPPEPVFNKLIGDPREPQDGLIANLSYSRFEGAVGPTLELLQWRPLDGSRWGWGIQGASFIELDSLGRNIYPERVSDWYLGTYFSESSGNFSHRFEYTHVSSHLGDEFFKDLQRFVYTRESFRFTSSFQPAQQMRFYAGAGYYPHIAPKEKPFFLHGGAELYTGYSGFLFGTLGRCYFTYDLKIKDEAGGVVNQEFQWGFQWKVQKEDSRSIRAALSYYNGNNEYGQFYRSNDNHWGLGIYFDP